MREHLADLTEEERDELLDGLEADLSEQLDAGDALPEPASYAAELRAAAGIPVPTRSRRPLRPGVPARVVLRPLSRELAVLDGAATR